MDLVTLNEDLNAVKKSNEKLQNKIEILAVEKNELEKLIDEKQNN